MKSGKTVFETVGGTPLLKLPAIGRELNGVELYAKAEYFNPTGSVKDPAATRCWRTRMLPSSRSTMPAIPPRSTRRSGATVRKSCSRTGTDGSDAA